VAQSPSNLSEVSRASQPESGYQQSLKALNQLIHDGGTMSGHERNCVFLNLRNNQFATVSAISGLDFPDDARTHALVDWDHDGDLDLWTANRTAPQTRFLRNELSGRFLAFKLRGTTSNRDGIGSRVQVILKGEPPLVRSLRAGEGFLGQGSKWVHFGLGGAVTIEKVIVRWPGSAEGEVFENVRPNGHYVLVQGSGTAEEWVAPVEASVLKPSLPTLPQPNQQAQLLLTDRLPLPPLDYLTFDQEPIRLTTGKPTLINLWASWCGPCLRELQTLTAAESQLRHHGVDIVALSIDEMDEKPPTGAAARSLLKRLGFPFDLGLAKRETIDVLQLLYDFPYRQHRAMPVPVSFLVDSDGRVAAIYRGPVEVERLLADIQALAKTGEDLRTAALPFPGKWHQTPQPPDLLSIPLGLMEKGLFEQALSYVQGTRDRLERNPEYAKLLVWLGDELFKRDRPKEAVVLFDEALKAAPKDILVMNNLAWQLAANGDPTVRDGERAVYWAERAAQISSYKNARILDTLAAAYAQAGRFENAIATATNALAQARSNQALDGLARSLERSLSRYRQGLAQP